MRLLVTGTQGQVVTALKNASKDQTWPTDITLIPLGRPDLDLLCPDTFKDSICPLMPDVIISAAAYTQVDLAEDDPETAKRVNTIAPKILAEIAKSLAIPLIHLSTDYVFSGNKNSPYTEQDATDPLGVYGRTKHDGEVNIINTYDNHVIVRTSWVVSPYGQNFVKTMLRLAQTRDDIGVVNDQLGCLTSADELANALCVIAARLKMDPSADLRGVFHLCGPNDATWFEIAKALFQSEKPNMTLRAIETKDYPTKAKRPRDSRLDTSKIKALYNIRLSPWQDALDAIVKSLNR